MDLTFREIVEVKLLSSFGVYLAIVLAGVVWSVWKWRKLSPPARVIGLIVSAVFFFESLGVVLVYYVGTNYPAYNTLHVFQFLLYGLAYAKFTPPKGIRRAYLFSGIGLSIFALIDSLFITGFTEYRAVVSSVLHFYVVLAALTSFFVMLRHPESRALQLQPLFWFNLANLFFYASTFFFYGLFNFYINENLPTPEWIREVQKATNYFLYSSYLVALVIDSKRHAG
jgi:hypothetical protein